MYKRNVWKCKIETTIFEQFSNGQSQHNLNIIKPKKETKTINKTHYIITMLWVENQCLEVNMHATLWSYPLSEVTCRNMRYGDGVAVTETLINPTRHCTIQIISK